MQIEMKSLILKREDKCRQKNEENKSQIILFVNEGLKFKPTKILKIDCLTVMLFLLLLSSSFTLLPFPVLPLLYHMSNISCAWLAVLINTVWFTYGILLSLDNFPQDVRIHKQVSSSRNKLHIVMKLDIFNKSEFSML